MKNEISGVMSDNSDKNIVISSRNNGDIMPLFKDDKYMLDNASFIKFIKNVEMQVRTSKDYKAYIRYLKEDLNPKLNFCMVYSNLTDDMCNIEMHHFLFTLYDIVEIIIGYLLKSKIQFSSSLLFHYVMEEHRLNNIPVIMLSEAVHIAIHNNKNEETRFLDYRSAHGNIVEFLNKYYQGLSFTHICKLKKYLDSYERYSNNSPDKFFDECITLWNKEIRL